MFVLERAAAGVFVRAVLEGFRRFLSVLLRIEDSNCSNLLYLARSLSLSFDWPWNVR